MSLVEAAEAVRQKGRYGDSVLMHVNPQEMQTLATGSGGYLTVNPDTGLPEAFLPALLPILGGLGGTALATSGMLAGAGGLGAFMAANPYIAGAIGTGLGKTLATGDIEQGIKTGLISGVTGGLLQGLTGGDIITSPDAIGASGMEAAIAGDTAGAVENILPATTASDIAPGAAADFQMAAGPIPDTSITSATLAQDFTDTARSDLLQNMADAGITNRFPTVTEPGMGAFKDVSPKDVGLLDKLAEPARPAYVNPVTGEFVAGQVNPVGQAVGGVGSAILEESMFPAQYDFADLDMARDREVRPQRFGVRDRFTPDASYRGGIDPEFSYFSPTRFVADGGAMRMQNGGGLAALEEMQGMNPVASGLGAMAGVMEGSDPDSSMMQIQEMMMEGPSPDGDMQDIVVQEAISAIRGEHANPEIALQAFVTQFGQDALGVLAQQVNQEMMLEQMGQNKDMLVEGDGMIEGIGKGRDDMVQATLEGEQDVLLSRGEFVVPSDVVSGIGDGSSQAGEDELMKLIDRVRTRRTGTKEPPNMVGEVLPS